MNARHRPARLMMKPKGQYRLLCGSQGSTKLVWLHDTSLISDPSCLTGTKGLSRPVDQVKQQQVYNHLPQRYSAEFTSTSLVHAQAIALELVRSSLAEPASSAYCTMHARGSARLASRTVPPHAHHPNLTKPYCISYLLVLVSMVGFA